ncbi:c-type cytochrome [Tateyamaria armeniaca]|uniref:C-type cytochrome n=1 Tax=Tateyamaria armeniaca TaxID=2518930 RepID=A0ABW8URQ9_9RHOB
MTRWFAIFVAVGATAGAVSADDAENGAELYRTHCAVCHGLEAYGDGPMAAAMVVQPPDLTQMTARNGGVFPVARIVMRIDGRDPLVSHGSSMPVYGEFFDVDSVPLKAETGQPIITSSPVVDLVEYLRQLQE